MDSRIFGLKSINGGFAIIVLLDIFVILTVQKFYTVSKTSALLLTPYSLWLIFATYLNFGYLVLNSAI